ncbi:MAG: DUF1223 domain-containing protein [Hyphomicrobiaceae bacterium]|nr:DUF1223 domain-containing protein [Hyphomicrobiaceae bacterium]
MSGLALAALGLGLFPSSGHGQSPGDGPRAVVELFTSQGCSSCPPADRLMGELARDPKLVVLTWPVDYWDYLGWKDTLARPDFTARQKAYAEARGDRAVYTPQVVVGGLDHVVGSDHGKISAAMTSQQAKLGAMPIVPDIAVAGDVVAVKVPGRSEVADLGGSKATVWMVSIKRQMTVSIGRGENSGATVTYTNVVRGVQSLGMWKGTALNIEFPRSELDRVAADGCVVLVQMHMAGKPARIIGAASLPMAGL